MILAGTGIPANRPILRGPIFCQDSGRSLGSGSGSGLGFGLKIDYNVKHYFGCSSLAFLKVVLKAVHRRFLMVLKRFYSDP